MPWRHGPALALALALLPPQAQPQAQPRSQSLDDALGMAYETNPQLLAARARLREIDEGVPQALSGWRPRVTLDSQNGIAAYDDSIDRIHKPEHRAPQDYSLTVDQNLFTSGRVASQVEQAKARVLSGRADLLAAESQAMLAAGTAYLDVVRDRRIVQLEANQTTILDRTVRAATTQLAAGAITDADLAQAQAQLANQQATDATAEAVLRTSEATYEQQVGQLPGPVALPTRSFHLPTTLDQALAASADGNPNVAAARYALDASRLGIDIARDMLLPQVVLHLLAERARQTEIQTYVQRDNIAQGTVEVRVPLYQGGEEYSRIREAKEQSIRFDDMLDQTHRLARQQTQAAWASLTAARERVDRQRISVAADEVALRGISRQQLVGARTVVDVLNAQQALLTATVAEVVAEHDRLVATLQVLDVIGQLDAQHLRLPVPDYDPTRHFEAVHEEWLGTSPPGPPDWTPPR